MSYSSEVNLIRSNPNPIRIEVRDSNLTPLSPREHMDADSPLYKISPKVAARQFAEKALFEGSLGGSISSGGGSGRRGMAGSSITGPASPTASYGSLHNMRRRHSVENGMAFGKDAGN